MSPARNRRRRLTSTVALAAAGSMALAPIAPGFSEAMAQEAGSALEPVTIRVGANAGFTKVEFAGVVGSRARIRRDGQNVIIRIGTTAAPDVSRLRVDPPAGVTDVQTRAVQGATELVLTLAPGADIRTGTADGAVWLNLYASAAAAPSAPTSAQGTLAVAAHVSDDKVELTFPWTDAVGAAVFRRGEAVWIVFDRAARLDMRQASALGPVRDPQWRATSDSVALRLEAPEALAVTAAPSGNGWTVTIGGPAPLASGVELTRDDTAEATLVARMAGAGRAIWLTDPEAGDRFAAVTARAPGKGLGMRRQGIDLTLLPTAHGLALETPADNLIVKAEGDLVSITRPGGLIVSPPETAPAAPETGAPAKAAYPALILADWAQTGHDGFAARYRALQDSAAQESAEAGDNPRAPIGARMAFARFLAGSGLHYEAIGVLNALVAQAPNMAGEPEVRGLRGASRVAIGRISEAEADLAAGALAGDPSAAVWRGYVAVHHGDWTAARQAFGAGAAVIDEFTPEWRARFGAAHARAAIETGDLVGARALLAYAFSQPTPAADQLEARLVQARLFELEGQTDRALAVYRAVARAPLDGIATPARLGVIRLSLAKGTITPAKAAEDLESLRWRWRGDATELAVIRELGKLYVSQGLYREALTALKAAGPRVGQMPGATELQADLSNAFRALFLEGGADGLQPIQALGLFYDFRELTPVGADGDEMVRRLARRLIDVDLLDQAAELLKYQVENRLEGVAKAQVATDLATVYLMDRQPEPALQALWSSRTTLLPTALNAERRALEARALMDLGRQEHALEVLGTDSSPAARDVRAEILWKQQNYAAAAALYDARLGERFRDTVTPLTADEEARLLRAGIGYSLARDTANLTRLSRNYAPFVERARNADALRIALEGLDVERGMAGFGTITRSADTFSGWVNGMKTQLRNRASGNRPATPARPAAPAAAPTPQRPAA